jgi:hypothetical protein
MLSNSACNFIDRLSKSFQSLFGRSCITVA